MGLANNMLITDCYFYNLHVAKKFPGLRVLLLPLHKDIAFDPILSILTSSALAHY